MKIIDKIKRRRPITKFDFEEMLGIDLIGLDHGCFREVYHISGTRLVVKIPMEGDCNSTRRCNISHARREIRRIRQALRIKSLRHIRRYVPKIYHMDYESGVIVMDRLHMMTVPKESEDVIAHMFEDTFRCIGNDSDLSKQNLGYDGRGQIKVIDWGCV